MMNGEFTVDGNQIATWSIKRRSLTTGDPEADKQKTMVYEWRVSILTEDGEELKKAEGTIEHRPVWGAMYLLQSVLHRARDKIGNV